MEAMTICPKKNPHESAQIPRQSQSQTQNHKKLSDARLMHQFNKSNNLNQARYPKILSQEKSMKLNYKFKNKIMRNSSLKQNHSSEISNCKFRLLNLRINLLKPKFTLMKKIIRT